MSIKIKKAMFKVAYPIMRIIWKIFKPNTIGVRVAIFNSDGEILLVKHTYRGGYFFPGGGLHKGETFREGMVREVKEETNLVLNENALHMIGTYQYFEEGKNDIVVFAMVNYNGNKDDLHIDPVEISNADWFKLDKLPEDLSSGIERRLKDIKDGKSDIYSLW